MTIVHGYLLLLLVSRLFLLSVSIPHNPNVAREDVWLPALPFSRTLQVDHPVLEGKDIVILQNLLRRHRSVSSLFLAATGVFEENTRDALKAFQVAENLSQQNGILDPVTGKKVIELLMHDGYRDNGTCLDGSKFKLHVPLYRNRSIETIATLYKCGDNARVLHTFKIRARGGTKRAHALNQLTSNGDTPTGLSTLDLNSKFPGSWLTKLFGPYPILRIVKGISGNVAIGKDNAMGHDGKDTFLNDYRFGILVHTGIWKNWNITLPMPNSLGCMKVHPTDQKKIVELLLNETGAVVNKNTYGKLPYPYKAQGCISVEEIY